MRYIELVESPISSMSFDGPGGDFFAGASFSKVDKDLLQSEKGRTKIIKAFEKTPFDFELFFISSDVVNGDNPVANIQTASDTIPVGIKNKYDQNKVNKWWEKDNAWRNQELARAVSNPVVKGVPGKIRLVLPTNLSDLDNKMPMTSWTVAHKIGHTFQDHFYQEDSIYQSVKWSSKLGNIVERIGLILEHILLIEQNKPIGEPDETSISNSREFRYNNDLISKMTMKSAREHSNPDKKRLTNSFEIFPELVAQWLISGRVTMTVNNSKSVELVDQLNQLIGTMFQQIVGKVIVAT